MAADDTSERVGRRNQHHQRGGDVLLEEDGGGVREGDARAGEAEDREEQEAVRDRGLEQPDGHAAPRGRVVGEAFDRAPHERASVGELAEEQPAPCGLRGEHSGRRTPEALRRSRETRGQGHGGEHDQDPRPGHARPEHLLRERVEAHDPDLRQELGRDPERDVDFAGGAPEPRGEAQRRADGADEQRPGAEQQLGSAARLPAHPQQPRADQGRDRDVEQQAESGQELHGTPARWIGRCARGT